MLLCGLIVAYTVSKLHTELTFKFQVPESMLNIKYLKYGPGAT